MSHIDRYTIREDAVGNILDDRWAVYAVSPSVDVQELVASTQATLVQTEWLGVGTNVLLTDHAEAVESFASDRGRTIQDRDAFHQERARAGFPWHGIDFDEKNLPQETGRDEAHVPSVASPTISRPSRRDPIQPNPCVGQCR